MNSVHTKFMLVDPLSADAIVITGSASWILPSVKDNDENMVVIRGESRVADIYFTEFMHIFAHLPFPRTIEIHLEKHGSLDDWKPQDLFETSKERAPQHFKTGSEYALRQAYFAG